MHSNERIRIAPTIVIHFGTNGPSGPNVFDLIPTEFKSIMDTVGTISEVYFVSLTVSPGGKPM